MKSKETRFVVILALCLSIYPCACSKDDDHDDVAISVVECFEINENCKDSAETAREEYLCSDTEPETQACIIETEGFYQQFYFDCMKEEVGGECENLLMWEHQCLAKCYYAKISCDSFELAYDECTDRCVADY